MDDNGERNDQLCYPALFGSIERFIGILIEYFECFPLWLSQVNCHHSVNNEYHGEYANQINELLKVITSVQV